MNKLFAGLTIGKLTLLHPDQDKRYYWRCHCDCGKLKSIRDSSLRSGKSQSCGCLRFEMLSSRQTHGMTDTPTYKSWQWMKDRVKRKSDYRRNGIKVCQRWLDSFDNFLADMGEKPEGHRISVERLNNQKGYEPGNCEWATPLVQNRNKGKPVLAHSERFNATKPLEEWIHILNSQMGESKWNRRRIKSEIDFWGNIDPILLAARITSLCEHCAHDEALHLVAA